MGQKNIFSKCSYFCGKKSIFWGFFWDFLIFFFTILDFFLMFWVFYWIFWIFFGFWRFFWLICSIFNLTFFWILEFWEFFLDFYFCFYGFFRKLLRLLLKVTKVSNGNPKWPKMGQNSIIKPFFARRAKKPRPKAKAHHRSYICRPP